MKQLLHPEIREISEALQQTPAVSIIIPFEPKMSLKRELSYSLKIATDQVERELDKSYPAESAANVMEKLKSIINTLNFNTHKKSIAIYVSPAFEKVIYLDIPVTQRIIVGNSFEIRDLVYNKKEMHEYLVLVISAKESQMYLGSSGNFVRIVSNTPRSALAYVNDVPERVANFSDISERKEVLMEKFLRHIDNALDLVLNAYRLPLFVLGPERVAGHFYKLTRHRNAIVEFVRGNYDRSSSSELREVLLPYIDDWKKVKQKDILNRLTEAKGKRTVSSGIHEVWRQASRQNGRLLVVEKNYVCTAGQTSGGEEIDTAAPPFNHSFIIKDAVDDVIEKVLENGGDVEFVDPGLLKDYGRIALIQFYPLIRNVN